MKGISEWNETIAHRSLDVSPARQARDRAPYYQHSEIGYNYRLINELAGIGRGQLRMLQDRVAARRRNFRYYPVGREDLRLALEAANIEAQPVWKPMHLQPVFAGYICAGGAVAEDLFERGLYLPSGSSLTEGDLERIVSVIHDAIRICAG